MERETFVFYKDWMEAIRGLPDDIRLDIYESVIEYATTGNIRGLKPMASIAFNFIKTTIDRDVQSYVDKCERNRENGMKGAEFGKLGGRPPKEGKPQKTPDGVSETPKNPEKPIDSDSDSDSDPDPDSDNEITPNGVVELWNSTCAGLGKIQKLTDSRRRKIKTRLSEFGKTPAEQWSTMRNLFDKIRASKFLNGDNNRSWVARFDWVFENDKNWIKVMEGQYDKNLQQPQTQSRPPVKMFTDV